MAFKPPKGTEDFYPADEALKQYIFGKIRTVLQNYNFSQIETPALEDLKLLTEKEGEETVSQIFTLSERGSERLGLRFDLTVPITRMFITKQRELQKPVKWFNINRMWRYERPQKGRMREFYQSDIEIFGSDKPASDAEVINVAIAALKALGLTKDDFVVKINNRYLLQGVLEELGSKNIEEALRIIDKRLKISEEQFENELSENLSPESIQKLKALFTTDLNDLKWLNETAKKGQENLQEIFKLIPQDFVAFDPSICRGLAYYTGMVFEIHDRDGEFRSICGGGRYNNLVKLFGGEDTPATGFGMGYSTLTLLLEKKNLIPKIDFAPDYYIGAMNENAQNTAIEIANKLRAESRVEIDLMGRNVGKQMKYANQLGAKKVIIIGDDEIKNGIVKIKDMQSGEEQEKKLSEF